MGEASINFNSHSIIFNLRGKTIIRKWLQKCALKQGYKIQAVSYIFCSDAYLLKINQDYLNHSTFTDIITFDLSEKNSFVLEGDVFISVERVKENARLFKVPFYTELNRVMIHGLLHMMGYKDKTADQKLQMRKMEDACVSLFNKLK